MADLESFLASQVFGERDRTKCPLATDIEPSMGEDEIGDSCSAREFIVSGGDANLEPYVGMEFQTEEAAFSFYTEYARHMGFGIRKKSTRYSKCDKKLIATQYVCHKEGFKPSNGTVKNPRPTTREGCKARIRLKKMDSGKWVVHDVEKDHNHALAGPPTVKHLRSHKKKVDVEHYIVVDKMEINSAVRIQFEENPNLEPCAGMEFDSQEAAHAFYNEYARLSGFSTHKRSTRYSRRDKTLIAIRYECSKGVLKQSNETNKSRQPMIRVGCQAMVKVKKKDSGKWFIHSVEKEHNHELDRPKEMHCLPSHRKLSANVKCLMNPSLPSISNIGLTKNDGKNCDEQSRQLTLARGEAKAVVEYCKHKQAENPSFFYSIEIDDEEHMRNVFWAESKSRMASNYFGDVVALDTTYLMKKFHTPLATFTGVNHHGQSVLLGCALLADLSASSLAWFFQTWLIAMSGRHPISIITEQDRAIQTAVSEVFPETHHRLCMSDIERNVFETWSHMSNEYGNFVEEFDKCIYQTDTVDEFELRWGLLLNAFGLRENEWLKILYEDRRQWVPVHLRGKFFAGMSTAHGREGINPFFYGHVSEETTLQEFLPLYDLALQNHYDKEFRADYETMYTKPNLMVSSPLEKQAADVYTREVFKKFQVEICETGSYYARKTVENGSIITYMVAKFGEEKNYTVRMNVSEMRVYCTCDLFEFVGILCRHALRVFMATNIFTIPPHYILKRWTKDAKSRLVLNDCHVRASHDLSESMIVRYNDLCQLSIKFAAEAALSLESYNVALSSLQEALGKVVIANDSHASLAHPDVVCSNHQQKVTEANQLNLSNFRASRDSQYLVTKGDPPTKRLRLGLDMNTCKIKMRSCRNCKKMGHNICTCKEILHDIQTVGQSSILILMFLQIILRDYIIFLPGFVLIIYFHLFVKIFCRDSWTWEYQFLQISVAHRTTLRIVGGRCTSVVCRILKSYALMSLSFIANI